MNQFTWNEYKELLMEEAMLTDAWDPSENPAVTQLTYESQKVQPGCLFVCKGAAFRQAYLEDALARGAVGYVSEKDYGIPGVPHLLVKDIRKAMPSLAKKFYCAPDEELKIVALTGTKGKTTTAYFIKELLDEALERKGQPESAFLSTVEVYDGKSRQGSSITTPESMELYRHFRNAADSDISLLTMEVSSQALKYDRVLGIPFEIGVFLNISEDHISPVEHPDFEDYFQAKLSLFSRVKTAVINRNADHYERILEAAACAEQVVTFGTELDADVFGYEIRTENGKITFRVRTESFDEKFTLAMHGIFNVENALAAIAVGTVLGFEPAAMKAALERVQVGGRMEEYTSRDGAVHVIVDYAHNGLSFRKIFESSALEYPEAERRVVFGCPGGKAINRRGDMGEAVSESCVKAYLTADDPGPEKVEEICRQIAEHIDGERCSYECIPDRAEAIEKAIAEIRAEGKDSAVLLVLGKGSETAQKIEGKSVPYESDAAVVKRVLGI
ncbi:MAG: UDP-N-acetylmuramoyl-L-alanyl-D-glutamate--2,6-diaminopimelate ligase [Lachnospiraceae bacterium]|nr:UDP-N-acetylmuramoyl-L-alanyl-D-glutamate--2,6-diaminopimelate ligase [Lachnospiraceae bacterium]